jgi:hypothetical protein
VLLILQCSVQCFVDHCLFLVGFVLLILQCSVQCFVNHCLFLMGFVLLILQCSVWCFVDHCLFLVGSYCSLFSVLCGVCRPLFVFSGVRIAHSSVFCVVFCRSLFVFSGFVLLILQCAVWCFVEHCL